MFEYFFYVKFFYGQYFGGNGLEYCVGVMVLVEGVDLEMCDVWYFEGEVGFEEFFEVFVLFVVYDVVDQCMYLFVFQWWQVDLVYIVIYLDYGWQVGGEVQV